MVRKCAKVGEEERGLTSLAVISVDEAMTSGFTIFAIIEHGSALGYFACNIGGGSD